MVRTKNEEVETIIHDYPDSAGLSVEDNDTLVVKTDIPKPMIQNFLETDVGQSVQDFKSNQTQEPLLLSEPIMLENGYEIDHIKHVMNENSYIHNLSISDESVPSHFLPVKPIVMHLEHLPSEYILSPSQGSQTLTRYCKQSLGPRWHFNPSNIQV